jgi:hypothetical protein
LRCVNVIFDFSAKMHEQSIAFLSDILFKISPLLLRVIIMLCSF